ncbi:hypothetical protein [Trinickia mobilis]|uniref:hypothetical protein n=1 Tax=Trinickia mobilis TaxID=2816356 RepID=UPI001A8C426F|nr:hypothetical protein [Trinickia mobilis]
MQYLKNALSSLGRHLHDSALHAFQGPHRWWKLAFFAAMFVLPGGSVLIALVAWFDHRRHQQSQATARQPRVAARGPYTQAPLRP